MEKYIDDQKDLTYLAIEYNEIANIMIESNIAPESVKEVLKWNNIKVTQDDIKGIQESMYDKLAKRFMATQNKEKQTKSLKYQMDLDFIKATKKEMNEIRDSLLNELSNKEKKLLEKVKATQDEMNEIRDSSVKKLTNKEIEKLLDNEFKCNYCENRMKIIKVYEKGSEKERDIECISCHRIISVGPNTKTIPTQKAQKAQRGQRYHSLGYYA